jgi:hypothetical protein
MYNPSPLEVESHTWDIDSSSLCTKPNDSSVSGTYFLGFLATSRLMISLFSLGLHNSVFFSVTLAFDALHETCRNPSEFHIWLPAEFISCNGTAYYKPRKRTPNKRRVTNRQNIQQRHNGTHLHPDSSGWLLNQQSSSHTSLLYSLAMFHLVINSNKWLVTSRYPT